MKRLISLLLAMVMAFSLVACGDKAPSGTDGTDPAASSTQALGDSSSQTSGNSSGQSSGKPSMQGVAVPSPLSLEGVVALPADGIGTPGVDFQLLETGSVTGWDEGSVPYYNPLGSRELYSDVNIAEPGEYASLEIDMLADDGITPTGFSVMGWTVTLSIDNEMLTRNWLLYMAREQGATIYPSTLNKAVFSLMEGESYRWWGVATIEGSTARIELCRTNYLPNDKTLTLKSDSWEQSGEYYFYTDCIPGKSQSAEVILKTQGSTFDDGIRLFCGQPDYYVGQLRVSAEKEMGDNWLCRLAAPFGERQVFDDVPIVDGMLQWNFRLDDLISPESVSFTLTTVGDVHPITWGDELGLVKIVGSPDGGGAFLERLWSNYMGPPEFDAVQLSTPYRDGDGNYCILAPAGYYTANIGGGAVDDSMVDHNGRIQLVAVSAGEVTTITVPKELRSTYNELATAYADYESDMNNIEIVSAVDNGKTATVSVMINDSKKRELYPEDGDIGITENGMPGKITNIERLPGKVDVILCLDSSGSMRGSMQSAVDAAKRFVESLPDNASVSLIQFSHKLTEHPGTDKASALAALDKVKEGGDTAMYDAINRAVERLTDAERPYVVVFSDGADSIEPEVDGIGSTINRETLCENIKETDVAVLTIGFGTGHDPRAMMEISDASAEGEYFLAADKSALDSAFAAVSAKLGNQFVITYERPAIVVDEKSDVPVVSVMMDISGSMNLDPAERPDEDVDFRMDRAKAVFHDFILDLPQGTLMQYSTFTQGMMAPPGINYEQVTTTEKASILRALGSVQAGGGTPIQDALDMSLAQLAPISSTKRVLVFFTDAALAVEDDGSGAQQMRFEETLQKLKDSGIRVMFLGLGGTEYAKQHEDVFRSAAELAGGEYLITDSVDEIAARLAELQKKIEIPVSTEYTTQLGVELDCKTEDGSRLFCSVSEQLEKPFSRLETKGETKAPSVVTQSFGEKFVRYDREASQRLYGADAPGEDSVITSRISYTDAKAFNKFGMLQVNEVLTMSRFKGMEVPFGSFVAMDVSLTFKKQEEAAPEIGYQIPSIFQHFYTSVNEGRMMPASQATWLTETPLSVPGTPSLQVMELKDEKGKPLPEGETISGMLVFLSDKEIDDELTQLSLHFYDITYGHIEIPLVGVLPQNLLDMTQLPAQEPADISKSFSMTMSGLATATKLTDIDLAESYENRDCSFVVAEAQFASKVQALLSLEPEKRFYYKLPTDSGELLARMSPIVENIPFGFVGDTMLAPGSITTVRMPFVLPNALLDAKATLWGDLSSGSFDMVLQDGDIWQGGKGTETFTHEYFTLTVNRISTISDSKTVMLDFTVNDIQDGEGTGGFDDLLKLEREVPEGGEQADNMHYVTTRKGLGNFAIDEYLEPLGIVKPDLEETRKLIFGASCEDAVWGSFDGQSRRGVLLYSLPDDGELSDWRLTCELLEDMSVPISGMVEENDPLLAQAPDIEVDQDFRMMLREKVEAAVALYEATHPEREAVEKIGLTDDEIVGAHVPNPMLTLYGSRLLETVSEEQDLSDLMNSLCWIPGNCEYVAYSPEAVLTQGWGFDFDFYKLAETILSKLGYQPKPREFCLTEVGKENLSRISNVSIDMMPNVVMAIGYTDAKGSTHVYVPALRTEAQNLVGLGYLSSAYCSAPDYGKARITVTASGTLVGEAGLAAQALAMNDIGSILGGAEENGILYESVTLLEAEFNLTEVGKDLMDVSFVSVGKAEDGIHDKVTAVADSRDGLLTSQNLWVNTADYEFDRIDVIFSGNGFYEDARHTLMLKKDEKLTDIFTSFAINTPSMTDAAAKAYEEAVSVQAAVETAPKTDYGTARWATHATLSRLLRTLGQLDAELSEKLGVQSARGGHAMALGCTLRSDGTNAIASTDLMQITNDLYLTPKSYEEGKDLANLSRSYSAMYGLMASEAEAKALPDGTGKSIIDVWATLPEDAGKIFVGDNMEEHMRAAEEFERLGAPAYLLLRLRDVECAYGTAFLLPTCAGTLNGEPCWAWLEIDSETMETVSVFDTGERSGMAAFALGLTPKSAVEFSCGALVGLACSNFAVSAYALETEDYGEINACAFALVGDVYKNLKNFQDGTGDIEAFATDAVGTLTGKAKDRLNEAVKERTNIDVQDLYKKIQGEFESTPTFADGFKAVIEAYFGESIED